MCAQLVPRGVVSFGLMRFRQSYSRDHLPFRARAKELVNIKLVYVCLCVCVGKDCFYHN